MTDWDKIAVLICTYGRAMFLERALFCLLNQTVPCKIIILNDNKDQILHLDNDRCLIINKEEKFSTIGEKRTYLVNVAKDLGMQYVCWLDDDDLCAPDFVEDFYRQWKSFNNNDILLLGDAYFTEGCIENGALTLAKEQANANINCFFGTHLIDILDGYGKTNTGEDQNIISAAQKKKLFRHIPRTGYIYCWGNGTFHISGQNKEDLKGYQNYVNDKISKNIEPIGHYFLKPRCDNYFLIERIVGKKFTVNT